MAYLEARARTIAAAKQEQKRNTGILPFGFAQGQNDEQNKRYSNSEKQVPFGDDNQKTNSNYKGNSED